MDGIDGKDQIWRDKVARKRTNRCHLPFESRPVGLARTESRHFLDPGAHRTSGNRTSGTDADAVYHVSHRRHRRCT